MGSVPGPFDCWLVLRGIRTLGDPDGPALRRTPSGSSTRLVAHPRVTAVHYPGLPDHPGHDVAVKQMRAFGGMVSFRVDGGEDAAIEVCDRAELFTLGESLGGVESLIEHPGRMTHASAAGIAARGAGRPGPAVGWHRVGRRPARRPRARTWLNLWYAADRMRGRRVDVHQGGAGRRVRRWPARHLQCRDVLGHRRHGRRAGVPRRPGRAGRAYRRRGPRVLERRRRPAAGGRRLRAGRLGRGRDGGSRSRRVATSCTSRAGCCGRRRPARAARRQTRRGSAGRRDRRRQRGGAAGQRAHARHQWADRSGRRGRQRRGARRGHPPAERRRRRGPRGRQRAAGHRCARPPAGSRGAARDVPQARDRREAPVVVRRLRGAGPGGDPRCGAGWRRAARRRRRLGRWRRRCARGRHRGRDHRRLLGGDAGPRGRRTASRRGRSRCGVSAPSRATSVCAGARRASSARP